MSEKPQTDQKAVRPPLPEPVEPKIVASPCGMLVTGCFICLCLIFIAVLSFQLITLNPDQKVFFSSFGDYFKLSELGKKMIISSLVASILFYLVMLYIPVRAFCQPSFIAGTTPTHKLEPVLILAGILVTYSYTVHCSWLKVYQDTARKFLFELVLIFDVLFTYVRSDDLFSVNLRPWKLLPVEGIYVWNSQTGTYEFKSFQSGC